MEELDPSARRALRARAHALRPVVTIGKILVVYRQKPPEAEKPAKKRRPRPRAPRKTKRSFQKA